jgi:hypothetical protein
MQYASHVDGTAKPGLGKGNFRDVSRLQNLADVFKREKVATLRRGKR